MTDTPETKRGRGRPIEYRPEFANEIVELMATGLSLTASMASLGFVRDTASDWAKRYPEFSDAIALGKGKRSLFLERRGIAAESGPAVTFAMKALANCNHEDFREKVEVSGDPHAPLKHVVSVTVDEEVLQRVSNRILGGN